MLRSTVLVSLVVVFGAILLAKPASAQPGAERAESELRRERRSLARDAAARDTVLNTAAAVPEAGTLRVTANGGADRSREDGRLAGVFGAGLLWSIGGGFATEAAATVHGGGAHPDVALRWQGLRQATAGIDLTTVLRYGTFGSELRTVSGGEIGAQIAIGRSLGRLRLLGNAMIARGVIVRTDVDAMGGAAALFDVIDGWRLGLDGRARTEVEDTYKTAEDIGRPMQLEGGLVSAHRYGPAYIQVFGGWQVPRGLAAPGPVVLATASVDF